MLRWLISTIGLAALKNEARAIARRLAIRSALFLILGLLWLGTVAFLLVTLAIWLAGFVGMIGACAIVAGILFLIGLIVLLVLALTGRRSASPAAANPLSGLEGIELNGPVAIALIALTGYLVVRQFFRR